MPERIDELMQQRAALVQEQRRILDGAEGENRNLNAEETTEYERIDGEIDGFAQRIRRLENDREHARSIAESETRQRAVFDARGEEGDPNRGDEQRAYDQAFDRYLRVGQPELTDEERKILRSGFESDETRDLTKGVNAQGGYTVPQGFYSALVVALEQASGVRAAGATRLETASGIDLPVPKVASTGHGAAAWATEGQTITATDETFGQVILKAYKAVKLIKVSLELLEDTGVNLESYIANELGKRIGRLEGDGFATGASGSTTTPEGVVNKGTAMTLATGSTTTITSDQIIDLLYSVARPYRSDPSAGWLMSDGIAKIVRKFKDSTGQYLWQQSMQAGEPDRLLGYPVNVEPSMPATPTANALTVVFGAMSGYFIRDVGGFRIFRLNERYMDAGEVGFLGWHRTDGDLVDAEAVAVMKQSAT